MEHRKTAGGRPTGERVVVTLNFVPDSCDRLDVVTESHFYARTHTICVTIRVTRCTCCTRAARRRRVSMSFVTTSGTESYVAHAGVQGSRVRDYVASRFQSKTVLRRYRARVRLRTEDSFLRSIKVSAMPDVDVSFYWRRAQREPVPDNHFLCFVLFFFCALGRTPTALGYATLFSDFPEMRCVKDIRHFTIFGHSITARFTSKAPVGL